MNIPGFTTQLNKDMGLCEKQKKDLTQINP
jgi:hypothetical protein